MKYFFNKWNGFARAIKNKNILLLFDFDGTLAPIVGEPKKAKLPASVREHLKELSGKRRITIGIVSGRELKDVTRLAGVKGIYYAGNHGLEIKGPRSLFIHPSYGKYRPYLKKIAAALKRDIAGIKGAIVEYKKLSVSLHYRLVAAEDIAKLKSIFKNTCAPYVRSGRVKTTAGKKILEVRPPVLWDKGEAVKKIEKMSGRKGLVKVFVGDDLTDEDAFNVLKKGDFSIRVLKKKSSKARYFLKSPDEVRRLLVKISKIVALFFIIISVSIVLPANNSFAANIVEELMSQETMEEIETESGSIIKVRTKTYTAKTKDGWEISINRYFAEGKDVPKPKAAVILCHGFNINNKFWDLDKRSSLARFLARAGYDIWSPSLRGSGLSSKPFLSRLRGLVKFELEDIPQMLIKTPFDITKFTWTIDDHIQKDVPTIIDFVRKKSGFKKVYWIGHSMGGIVMFGYLETKGKTRDDIAGFIPMASMMVIPQPLNPHLKEIASQKPLLTASLLVNSTVASQMRNFTFGTVKHPLEELLFERENMHDEVMFRFFRACIDDTSSGVVSQFSDSIRKGEMSSSDGRYSYTNNMSRVSVPILIMAGASDGFVTEKVMKGSYDRVSSKDKSMLIFSKANGYSTDYGHCDLILGKNSEKDVYPPILEWLDKRTSN